MFQFINDDLQKELKLPRYKRARKYAAMPHLVYLARLLWGYDWYRYGSPKDRLDLWDGILLNVFTSARVGEYIESTAREGSGRGLRYNVSLLQGRCSMNTDLGQNNQDVWFVVLRNEQGSPEFAMEVKKDGKGMTSTPWRK